MAYSFYGGKQGPSYKIVAHYDSIYDMVVAFQEGGDYNTVGYGEYVIIDTIFNNNQYSNPENGIIYRRGLNYIQNFNHNGIELGTINGEELRTVAKEAVDENGNKIYYDLSYDENNNPVYDFNEERFRQSFATFVQSPGGGAEYIGQIVGPRGSSPQIDIIDWQTLTQEYFNSDDYQTYHRGMFSQEAHPAVNHLYENYRDQYPDEVGTKTGIIKQDFYDNDGNLIVSGEAAQDNMNFAYMDILDQYGNIVGAYIAFDIPSPVFSYHAESIAPYTEGYAVWSNDNNRWEYVNLISEIDSQENPYYWHYNIKVPEGIHGKDLDAIGVNQPPGNYEKEIGQDVDSNETNHYYQFYYKTRDYATENGAEGTQSDSQYVLDGFLKSVYSIENDLVNPELEERQISQYYTESSRVYAPGLPTKILNDNHIIDLCLQAQNAGITGSNMRLDPGMLSKLNINDQIQDGQVTWKVVDSGAKPLSLIKVFYTHDGHDDVEIRSIEGISIDQDGNIYVKYSNVDNLFIIGENQSIESVEHVYKVNIPGQTEPFLVNRLCIHFNTYKRDLQGNIVIDKNFTIDPETKEIISFPTTDATGKKIQYIDEQIKFIDTIYSDPTTQEYFVVYTDETEQSLGIHRNIEKLELQNSNYLGGTQKFIVEYNTHSGENEGTDINDQVNLSDSINTIAAIRRQGEKILVLYSDAEFRKQLQREEPDSVVPIRCSFSDEKGWYVPHCSYLLYKLAQNGQIQELYRGDDEDYNLYWYDIGSIYSGGQIYGTYDSVDDLPEGGFSQEYRGWIAAVVQPNNVVLLYAYDYGKGEWQLLQQLDLTSVVNPEKYLMVRKHQSNNEELPVAPDNLDSNGYWFVIYSRTENAEPGIPDEESVVNPIVDIGQVDYAILNS